MCWQDWDHGRRWALQLAFMHQSSGKLICAVAPLLVVLHGPSA
jgi:hypothetical protein